MKKGIHLQKKRLNLITKDGSSIIYNIVQIIKKTKKTNS
jgi:hypothetical protein